jgi:hypothetical protein
MFNSHPASNADAERRIAFAEATVRSPSRGRQRRPGRATTHGSGATTPVSSEDDDNRRTTR